MDKINKIKDVAANAQLRKEKKEFRERKNSEKERLKKMKDVSAHAPNCETQPKQTKKRCFC